MLAPPQRLLRRHRLHGAERGRCRCCSAAPTAAAEPGEQQLPEICCSSLCSPCTRRGRRNGATTAAAEVRPCGTLQAIVEDRHRCAAPQRRCGKPLARGKPVWGGHSQEPTHRQARMGLARIVARGPKPRLGGQGPQPRIDQDYLSGRRRCELSQREGAAARRRDL